MKLHNLFPAKGSKHRRKIIGRGQGSGHGGSSTRGGKGQTARAGEHINPGFEGGQMSLVRRIPKRGFTNKMFRKDFNIVNVGQLEKKFESGSRITSDLLLSMGLIRKKNLPVKILGDGDLKKTFEIVVDRWSKSAINKIQLVGGSIVSIVKKSKQ